VALLRRRFEGGSPLCVVMTTFFSVQSDTSAVSDLRAWSEEQLIAAAKTGRRAPFGELCERHMKQVSCVTRRIIRNREDAEDAAQECFLNAFVHLKDFDGISQLILATNSDDGFGSSMGTSRAPRFLRSFIEAALIAMLVSQVANKDCQSHAE
jgi:RNA polymerase sigma-70 factor (ECF subfamily)